MALTQTTVTGRLPLPTDLVLPNGTVWFALRRVGVDKASRSVVMPVPVTAPVMVDGTFSIDLWPNERGDHATVYDVSVHLNVGPNRQGTVIPLGAVVVPLAGPVDIADLVQAAGPLPSVPDMLAQVLAAGATAQFYAGQAQAITLAPLAGVLSGGIVPLITDGEDTPLAWFDPRADRVRLLGDDLDPADALAAPFAVTGGPDVIEMTGPEGQTFRPASAAAPVVYAKAVDDGGGPVTQVHVCDGRREWRLTASAVDCHAPEVIAPDVVRYGRSDGVIGLARLVRDPEAAPAALSMHVVHGQSLAGGSSSFAPGTQPVLRHPPEARVKMFNGGVRAAFGSAAAVAGNFTSLVPACEVNGPVDTNLSDTGMTALGFGLSRETEGEVLVTATGIGGAPFEAIRKGTRPWENMLHGVRRAVALAPSGVTVDALHWRHGESQETASVAEYTAMINQAHADFIADVVPITGQAQPPVMVLQQIGRMEATGIAGVAAFKLDGPGYAVAEIARGADASKIVAAPQYVCEFGDVFHMVPSSYAFMASHAAKALRRHRLRRWRPLQAIATAREGDAIDIAFAGGWLDWGGALCLDTSWVTDPGQFGFVFRDGSQSARIQHVAVVDRATVRVRLDKVPTGEAMLLGIGFFASTELDEQGRTTGLRCCLRDNDPAACPVTGRPLHNYPIGQAIGVQ